MVEDGFHCSVRHFKNRREWASWFEVRSAGFGDWYTPSMPQATLTNNWLIDNAKAAIFPEFLKEVRTATGRPVAFLASVPMYWSVVPQSLPDLSYVTEVLRFEGRKMFALAYAHRPLQEWLAQPGLFQSLSQPIRQSRLSGTNALCIIAITVHPEFRRRGLPRILLEAAKEEAQSLGFEYVLGPFRPSAYGAFKAERRAAHSEGLFAEYCGMTGSGGLPVDPWLRAVARNGAQFVKIEPRSLVVRRSLSSFERYRGTHRSDDWYSPAKDSWECGETCTWYVDRARGLVTSVESNIWGYFDLRSGISLPKAGFPEVRALPEPAG